MPFAQHWPWVLCANCKRGVGAPAQGAAINAFGCTGACLHWAARLIKNPPTFDVALNWGAWHGVHPADVSSLSLVCRDLNKLGCAYLHWDVVKFHGEPGDVLAAEWLSAAHELYVKFLDAVDSDIVAELCPQVPQILKSLQHVHEICSTFLSVAYTLHCEDVDTDSRRVRTTNMSGEVVCENVLRRDESLNRWEHVPDPFFRIAEDGNLYTRQEFQDYYCDRGGDRWASACPCYNHAIHMICDANSDTGLSAIEFLHSLRLELDCC